MHHTSARTMVTSGGPQRRPSLCAKRAAFHVGALANDHDSWAVPPKRPPAPPFLLSAAVEQAIRRAREHLHLPHALGFLQRRGVLRQRAELLVRQLLGVHVLRPVGLLAEGQTVVGLALRLCGAKTIGGQWEGHAVAAGGSGGWERRGGEGRGRGRWLPLGMANPRSVRRGRREEDGCNTKDDDEQTDGTLVFGDRNGTAPHHADTRWSTPQRLERHTQRMVANGMETRGAARRPSGAAR